MRSTRERKRDAVSATSRLKQDESREIWVARYWTDFWHDVRYGARALLEQPGFAAAALAALVLGVAVNAVLFSVFNSLALAPWAIRDARHTVEVLQRSAQPTKAVGPGSPGPTTATCGRTPGHSPAWSPTQEPLRGSGVEMSLGMCRRQRSARTTST